MTTNVLFDRVMLERLRVAHKWARDQQQESFDFEGNVLVTDYAKYLIEYLDGKLAR